MAMRVFVISRALCAGIIDIVEVTAVNMETGMVSGFRLADTIVGQWEFGCWFVKYENALEAAEFARKLRIEELNDKGVRLREIIFHKPALPEPELLAESVTN